MPLDGACHRGCLHRAFVQDYRDARDAWLALRESDQVVDVAGGSGAVVAAYQLTDEEFAAAHPPPLFRDWLVRNAGSRQADGSRPTLERDPGPLQVDATPGRAVLSVANNDYRGPADAGDDFPTPYEQSEVAS